MQLASSAPLNKKRSGYLKKNSSPAAPGEVAPAGHVWVVCTTSMACRASSRVWHRLSPRALQASLVEMDKSSMEIGETT